MPKPKPGESRSDFVSRCMSDGESNEDFPSQDQRLAFCNSVFEDKDKAMITTERMILEALGHRKNTGAYGLRTAESFVRPGLAVGGLPSHQDENALIRDSALKLVYVEKDPDICLTKATEIKRIKEILGGDIPAHTAMAIAHTLTTNKEDRDGDILETDGAILDPKAPLLWQHLPAMPIGRVMRTIEQNAKRLRVGTALLDINDFTSDVVKLFEAEVLRFSHGFRALDAEPLEKGEFPRFRFLKFEIMEASAVSVPSNTDADVDDWAGVKGLTSDHFKAMQGGILNGGETQHVKGVDIGPDGQVTVNLVFETKEICFPEAGALTKQPSDPNATFDQKPALLAAYQFNQKTGQLECSRSQERGFSQVSRSDHKQFRPEGEYLEASKLEYEWASRYIGVEVKNLKVIETVVPGWRKGSWRVQLQQRQQSENWNLSDTRNITNQGRETPPLREVVELNSKSRDTFLSDGLEFWDTPHGRLCVKFQPGWGGRQYVTFYTADDAGQEIIGKTWTGAIEHNLLKGEAFALAGEFLEGTKESFDDVFLTDTNIVAVKKAAKRLNDKGKAAPNHGQVYMGVPGTGKTLSGRCLMNETTDATFIWISAKDFWQMGSMGAIVSAFDMAKELAPSILFFEDVDNYISEATIDLLKTEMDGIGRSSGILTVLTTNYPERLPAALMDRPGRFDDVLKFDLPTESIRRQMLTRWVPDASDTAVNDTAKKTEGCSGAHIYHISQYAKGILLDEEAPDITAALGKAMDKLDEQRQLIDDAQLAGSNYRPRKSTLCEPAQEYLKMHEFHTKGGMTKPEKKKIADSMDDLKAMLDVSGLKKGDRSLVRGSLVALKPLQGDEAEEEKKDAEITAAAGRYYERGEFPDPIKAVTKRQQKAVKTTVKNMDAILGRKPKEDVPREARSLANSVKGRLKGMMEANPGVDDKPNPGIDDTKPFDKPGDKPDDKPKKPPKATLGEHLAGIIEATADDHRALESAIQKLQLIADINRDQDLAKVYREFEANEANSDPLVTA